MVIHKTIIAEPYHLKEMIDTLNDNLKRYEKEYGKIRVPEAIKRAKKRDKSRSAISTAPDYLG